INPVLDRSLPYGAIPFDQIKPEDFAPTKKQALAEIEERLGEIAKTSLKQATFENTIEALEFAGEKLQHIYRIAHGFNVVKKSDAISEVKESLAKDVNTFTKTVTLDTELFKKVQKLYSKRARLNLDSEQM